jgi:hyperosmotically inducible protein
LTIKLALMADPILFPYEFEVDVSHEKAVVTGSVPTEEDKSRVTDVVKTVEGIESVTNKVTVSPALRASLTKQQDEAIAQFVKERLNRSETLKAVGFDVKSDQGVVSLSGKTRFQVIALEAAEAARHIPGVRAVNTTAVQITGKE